MEKEPPVNESSATPPQKEVRLVDMTIKNDNDALNLLVAFVGLAQNRGAFNLEEAGKIWECVKHFKR